MRFANCPPAIPNTSQAARQLPQSCPNIAKQVPNSGSWVSAHMRRRLAELGQWLASLGHCWSHAEENWPTADSFRQTSAVFGRAWQERGPNRQYQSNMVERCPHWPRLPNNGQTMAKLGQNLPKVGPKLASVPQPWGRVWNYLGCVWPVLAKAWRKSPLTSPRHRAAARWGRWV